MKSPPEKHAPRPDNSRFDDTRAMLDTLTRKDFTDLPEGALAIEVQGMRIALSVVSTHELPQRSPRVEPFSVILRGPPQPLLPQATYPLSHPVHGVIELFIVPVGRDAQGVQYEAIFN
jgi:hypothetical protein